MATPIRTQSPFLLDPNNPMAQEYLGLERQQKLADLLISQGAQQPQGQMVSGHFVKPSLAQNIAPLFAGITGQQLSKSVEQKQLALADQLRKQKAQGIQEFMASGQETPASYNYGNNEADQITTVTPAKPAMPYDQRLANLARTNPELADMLMAERFKTQKKGVEEELYTIGPDGKPMIVAPGTPKDPTEYKEYLKATQGPNGFKGNFFEYQQALKRAGATNVNVSTEKSYGSAFGQGLAKSDLDLYDQAKNAPQMLENVQSTKKLLDSGKVYTGLGANAKLDLARMGTALGVAGEGTAETVANTQQLFANRAQATLDSIKSSGLGAGQGFSNKDREFLEAAKLGNITYDKASLQRQLDIEERVARQTVNKWNNRLKSIPKSAVEPTGINEIVLPMQGQINTGNGSGRGWRLKENN
jgi:hypothetical protein